MTNLAPLLLKSAGLGLAVAAPVGPMSLLCMRRTLAQGWPGGLAIGAGIAVGDGLYAAVAALGLAGVSGMILSHPRVVHAVAGLALVTLGGVGLSAAAKPAVDRPGALASSTLGAVAGSALLTLANPPTIVMFAALFAGLAPRGGFQLPAALTTVGGVFAGSLAWWCLVVASVSLARRGIGARARQATEIAAGLFLVGFGVVELARAATGA